MKFLRGKYFETNKQLCYWVIICLLLFLLFVFLMCETDSDILQYILLGLSAIVLTSLAMIFILSRGYMCDTSIAVAAPTPPAFGASVRADPL